MKNKQQIHKMVLAAVLTAVLMILYMTPLVNIKFGILEITFMAIPVAIGAVLLGPWYGAYLGGVFGVNSLLQCLGLFGGSITGAAMWALNPALTILTCVVPRVLTGLLTGFIFRVVARFDRHKFVSIVVACISTPVLNTFLFLSTLWICFYANALAGNVGYIALFASCIVNALVEISCSALISFAMAKTLVHLLPRMGIKV